MLTIGVGFFLKGGDSLKLIIKTVTGHLAL
jgi:hypothetical protein